MPTLICRPIGWPTNCAQNNTGISVDTPGWSIGCTSEAALAFTA